MSAGVAAAERIYPQRYECPAASLLGLTRPFSRMHNTTPESELLVPGQTCWRIEQAARFTIIIDGAEYYRAVKRAILKANHQILMIGWDFDTRVEFEPDGVTMEGPSKLGTFLNWVAKRRPGLGVKILKWDLGILETLKRGETPLFVLQWMAGRGVELKLDGAHPTGASHHQKVIVIDDALAFCGGIDITKGRWDTREHLDGNPARRSSRGKLLSPWHDATTCMDGPVAKALGDLGRVRWSRATGEELDVPPPGNDPWPEGLVPTVTNVAVAISRTIGGYDKYPQVSEIENLFLKAIRTARKTLYIESQYFASRAIAEAIAERVKADDGPEIVIINPESQEGWLEEKTMGAARVRLLHLIKRADRNGRFRIFYPATSGGNPIYSHAKITIVDDRLLKVGSANLNNRSMGFDTECDITIEASVDDTRLRGVIDRVRNDLLAEHLGATISAVETKHGETGSLIATIDALRLGGKRLMPLQIRALDAGDETLAETDLVDPERPPTFWRDVKRRLGID